MQNPATEPAPTHAAMFKISTGESKTTTYFVMANREPPTVRGFVNMRKGLDYFEIANNRAHERGGGWAAGAMISFITLQPRIFHFGTRDELCKLLGETVYLTEINRHPGVFETAFRCIDQEAAALVYEAGTEPRLVPA
jgi:hypothetical protein